MLEGKIQTVWAVFKAAIGRREYTQMGLDTAPHFRVLSFSFSATK